MRRCFAILIERPIADLGLTTRATDALQKAGITNVGQFLEKLSGGNEAVLAIPGFGQASLNAAKKKLPRWGMKSRQPPRKKKALPCVVFEGLRNQYSQVNLRAWR